MSDASGVLVGGFDQALVGYSDRNGLILAVYDEDKCIEIIQEDDGVTYMEALEWFNDFVHGEGVFGHQPIFIRLEKNI